MPTEKRIQDDMAQLVERMLAPYRQPAEAKNGHEQKTLNHRRIDANVRQMDKPVYARYGLTNEEIAVAEGTKRSKGLQPLALDKRVKDW